MARSSPCPEVLRALCRTVCEALSVDGATLSLLTDTPSRQLLCASDATALCLEEVQFTAAEGPCITAAAEGTPVLVEDLREDLGRWPFFSAGMNERLPDVGAVYAFPLSLGDETLGSMDLLRHDRGGLDDRAVRECRHVADAVVEGLLSTLTELLTGSAPPVGNRRTSSGPTGPRRTRPSGSWQRASASASPTRSPGCARRPFAADGHWPRSPRPS
ncbi:GAF domain-containing protein [Streptomyces sp. AC555_RSS877]|uniref:GAF domain-containing protein n=1 Tax=Streptomyces sp. AC555_RSS877 TaxID=2823688 RepID=UPI001C275F6D|nr:GAF domain-containing protein [Streptomyces sp. AC555_RSS877]